jgi:hypothetical protein
MRKIFNLLRSPGLPRFALEMMLLGVPSWFALILAADADTLRSNGVYAVMYRLIPAGYDPDHAWATISAVVGLVALAGVASHHWLARSIAHLAITGWHGTVALSLWLAYAWNTGTGTYALLAAAATLLMLGDLCADQDHD